MITRLPFTPARCRSKRTLTSDDGQKAVVRCGLERGHGQKHTKHVTLVNENRTAVVTWVDGGAAEIRRL